MESNDSTNLPKEYVKEFREVVMNGWAGLKMVCPSLADLGGFNDFEEVFTIDELNSTYKQLYREVIVAFLKNDPVAEAFLIFVFSDRLLAIYTMLCNRYAKGYNTFLEDLWNEILCQFFFYLQEKGIFCPSVKTVCIRTRNDTMEVVRQYKSPTSGKKFNNYVAMTTHRGSMVAEGKHLENAIFRELMGYIKSRVNPEEYKAALTMLVTEPWDRSRTKVESGIKRDIPAERRLKRKLRYLLQNYIDEDANKRRRYLLM